jgi:hypothetical protein
MGLERRNARQRRHAGIAGETTQQLGRLGRAVGDRVGLHAAQEMNRDILPVFDEWSQHVGGDERVGKVDRSARGGAQQESDHVSGSRIGAQQIPAPVDHERRIRLLLRQHVVERAIHLRELGAGEVALMPHRREAGGEQQRILLAQRDIEHGAKPQHHLARRLGTAGFEEAQVALRRLRRAGERELRQAAVGTPPFQPRAECHYF